MSFHSFASPFVTSISISEIDEAKDRCVSELWWIFLNCSPYGVTLTYTPTSNVWEGLFPAASSMGCVIKSLDFCQPDRRKMVSQCSFNLHIFYHEWSQAYFQMFNSYSYFIFCELFISFAQSFLSACWAFISLFVETFYLLEKLALRLYVSCKSFL